MFKGLIAIDKITRQCILFEINKQREVLNKLEEMVNSNLNNAMYKIKEIKYKVELTCSHCLKYGKTINNCNQCGGKGTHKRTLTKWVIDNRMVEILKVSKHKEFGKVYYVSEFDFFVDSYKLLHKTEQQAQEECIKRNKILRQTEKEFQKQRDLKWH